MNEVKNPKNQLANVSIQHQGQSLLLLKEKAIWIPDLRILLIADLHFGKASHFRKSGIPIPEPIHSSDLAQLKNLHDEYSPLQTYFLGDLFHSDWNEQWETLNNFLSQFGETEFHLVKGNHDVLSARFYESSILKIHQQPLTLGNLVLSHEPMENLPEGMLNLCGHIHPGIRLVGKAKQSLRLACFFLSDWRLILPSFGNFTGLYLVKPKSGDKIWAITPEKIIPLLSGTSIG